MPSTSRPHASTARTELPAGATGPVNVTHPRPDGAAPSASVPKPNEVILSDGRRVTLRELDAFDEMMAESLLEEMGYKGTLAGLGQMGLARAYAMYAVVEIDGQAQLPPTTGSEFGARLHAFKGADARRIVAAYSALAGMTSGGDGAATFRGED